MDRSDQPKTDGCRRGVDLLGSYIIRVINIQINLIEVLSSKGLRRVLRERPVAEVKKTSRSLGKVYRTPVLVKPKRFGLPIGQKHLTKERDPCQTRPTPRPRSRP